jgi:signal transduction histidine kinase
VLQPRYSTSSGGTGFGLPLVGEIAEADRWQVRITEGSDDGAQFEFTGVKTGRDNTLRPPRNTSGVP